jgi:ABC-type Fe3+ transport system substrate-binding protein
VNVNPSAVDVVAENVGVGASGGSVTVKANVADDEPPVFVAVIVYVVAARVAVGVPVIKPVDVEKLSPAARAEGLIE